MIIKTLQMISFTTRTEIKTMRMIRKTLRTIGKTLRIAGKTKNFVGFSNKRAGFAEINERLFYRAGVKMLGDW
jgi:hypothetical protein